MKTLIEIQNILEEKKNAQTLSKARKHDERMLFYSDRMYNEKSNKYAKTFFENIENKLQNIKSIDNFKLNIKFPLEINNFTAEVIGKLSEIWNSQNKVFNANFNKAEKDVFFNLDFYQNEVFDKYFKSPNTLIYLEYLDGKINYKFIPVSLIVEFSKIDKNIFEYIIISANDSLYYIDSNCVVELKSITDNLLDIASLKIVSEIELIKNEVCPIFHISDEIYNSESNFVRTNIFANSLSYLDLLQEVIIYKKMLTPFAFNLIIEKYRNPDCNYRTEDTYCQNGFLHRTNENNEAIPIYIGQERQHCPVCNPKISPGMTVEKSSTFSLDKSTVISDVIRFISPDTNILTYSDEFIKYLKESILNSIIGKTKDNIGKQNSNELSVVSSNMEKLQVILSLKSKFENVIKNIETAKAKWLYGNFNFWTINLGTNFLLKGISELYNELEFAKKNNPQEVYNIKKQIITTKYANDKISQSRELILLDFIPSANLEDADANNKLKLKQIYAIDFINDYENKNGNIGQILKPKNQIINILNKEFENFLSEIIGN